MALGKNWFKMGLDREPRAEIENRISKANEKIKDFQYPENPLDYASLENLKEIILSHENWTLCFYECFEDKEVFGAKMQEIIDVRNNIAHSYPIHLSEAASVTQNVLWMLTHMREYF